MPCKAVLRPSRPLWPQRTCWRHGQWPEHGLAPLAPLAPLALLARRASLAQGAVQAWQALCNALVAIRESPIFENEDGNLSDERLGCDG